MNRPFTRPADVGAMSSACYGLSMGTRVRQAHRRLDVVLSRANERFAAGGRPRETNVVGAFPPLGIAQLGAVVRASGRNVRLFDGTIRAASPEEHARAIGKGFRGLAAFSTSTLNWRNTLAVIRALKRIAPESTVVVGGPQMDVYPEEVLQFPQVDFGIMGEGEYALPALIEVLEGRMGGAGNGEFGRVPGLVFRTGTSTRAEVVRVPPAPPIKDLGKLPFPALDLLPLSRYRVLGTPSPFSTLITSRGCPFRCNFCSQQYAGGLYRRRPVRHVLDEITWHIQRFRSREIIFFDETFTIGEARVIEICEGIMDLGVRVGFNIRARADTMTRDMARALVEAGCTSVNIGIEAGSERVLKVMNKAITIEQIERTVRICFEAGLRTRGYFMLGYVGESVEEMKQTVDLACRLPLDYASFTITQLNPATTDYRQALARGEISDFWRDYTLEAGDFRPEAGGGSPTPPRPTHPDYDEAFLKSFLRFAYRRFYLRPHLVARRLADLRVWRWAAESVVRLFD